MSTFIDPTSPSHYVVSSRIYKKRVFLCFRSTRFEFTTSDGKTYDVAARVLQTQKDHVIPKRFFAIQHNSKTILINKNSFRDRFHFSKNLINEIVSTKTPCSLETFVSIKQNLRPLINSLAASNSNKLQCQQTAFKITLFMQQQKELLEKSWQKNDKFIFSKMADGRPYIIYRDANMKLNCLVSVSFQAKILGSGGYKEVTSYYNFQKQKENRAVSIQNVKTRTEAALARQELQFLEQFKENPLVMKVKASYDSVISGTDDSGSIITVMKKYEGNFNDCLSRFTKETNLLVFRKLVKVVSELNKNGIIHRDIKFQNVLFKVKKDGTLDIKLTDLGLACKKADKHALLARAGTTYYMPPEVLGHDVKVEPEKIDSWPLGIMLYKIYFGKRIPFAVEIAKALSDKNAIYTENKKLLIEHATKLIGNLEKNPDPWVQLMVQLLQPDPQKRISSENALQILNKLLKINT